MPEAAGFDFVASPLSRSRETMEIARAAMGLPPTAYATDDRLKELTFGGWEGFTGEDLRDASAELIAAREKQMGLPAARWRKLPHSLRAGRRLARRHPATDLRRLPWRRRPCAPPHDPRPRPDRVVSMLFPQDKVLVFKDGREGVDLR